MNDQETGQRVQTEVLYCGPWVWATWSWFRHSWRSRNMSSFDAAHCCWTKQAGEEAAVGATCQLPELRGLHLGGKHLSLLRTIIAKALLLRPDYLPDISMEKCSWFGAEIPTVSAGPGGIIYCYNSKHSHKTEDLLISTIFFSAWFLIMLMLFSIKVIWIKGLCYCLYLWDQPKNVFLGLERWLSVWNACHASLRTWSCLPKPM